MSNRPFLPPDPPFFGSGFKTKPNACLKCTKVIDAGSAIGMEAAQRPGAFCLCVYCGHMQIYTDDLSFRELCPEEWDQVRASPQWPVVQVVQERARKRNA